MTRTQRCTLFPYTTLFRSKNNKRKCELKECGFEEEPGVHRRPLPQDGSRNTGEVSRFFGNPVGVNLTELDGTVEAGPEVAQTIATRFTNVPSTRQSGVYLTLTPKGKRTAGHLLWKDADLRTA